MYIYEKLKEAVPQGTDTSPNSIKALIITRSYILVVYHNIKPKLVQLSVEESTADISTNQGRGALHNLLSQRKLSCLEEIYIDSVFQNYTQIFDLVGYVEGLVNTVSRLRYYGYIADGNPAEPATLYSNALVNLSPDYAFALDNTRKTTISYVPVDNDTWYKKYNLRPEYYKADGPNGKLSAWFRRVEGIMSEKHEQEIAQLTAKGISEAMAMLYAQDCNDIKCLSQLFSLKSFIKGINSPTTNVVYKAITDNLAEMEVFPLGESLIETLKERGLSPNNSVLSFYKKAGVLQGDKPFLDACINRVKAGQGCLGISRFIERVSTKLIECASNTKEGALMCQVCISDMDISIINGDIKETVKAMDTSTKTILLLGVCGFTPKSLYMLKKGGNLDAE